MLASYRFYAWHTLVCLALLMPLTACHFWISPLKLSDPMLVELTAQDHLWQIVYDKASVGSSENVTQAYGDIHVPAGMAIVLTLKSSDYIYTVALPELDARQIAVPNLEFQLALSRLPVGKFQFTGEQMCNEPNTQPPIYLIVEDQQSFTRWLEALKS